MKKTILCLLLMCGMVTAISAETVLLFSEKPTGVGNEQESVGYIEDGIMDVFFTAGHIIFNGGYQQFDEETTESQNTFVDDLSFRQAKSGGAHYVLQVQLRFNEDDQDTLPVKALYRFYELKSEEQLVSGEVPLTESGNKEKLEDWELIRKMGKEVGSQALKKM